MAWIYTDPKGSSMPCSSVSERRVGWDLHCKGSGPALTQMHLLTHLLQ